MELSMSILALSLQQLIPLLAVCTAVVVILFLFRPLIVGIARAGLLVLRPRLSREERLGRAQMRNARTVQCMIDASCGPSQAAELRAIAARA